MVYRTLGRTGIPVGIIGLGCEYLIGRTDRQVRSVISHALDAGVNYFDLFYAQPRIRDLYGAAMAGRRKKVMIAGHLGAWYKGDQYARTRDIGICTTGFHDLLKRLRTDYIDVLFLHNCDEQDDYAFVISRLYGMADAWRREGKVRFIGFSGHNPVIARQAVETGLVDILMIQVHLREHTAKGREELYEACIRRNAGIVAMKPYAGGQLLSGKKPAAITPVKCLGYALSRPAICTVVPGAKNLSELNDALGFLDATDRRKDFSRVLAEPGPVGKPACVYCNHCLPCPSHIDIGRVTRLVAMAKQGGADATRREYSSLKPKASACIDCSACTKRCPWDIDAPAAMREAVRLFE